MAIPNPTSKETQDEFISRCIPEIVDEYDSTGQAYAVCRTTYENATQGGVAGMSQEFGRKRFEYPPLHKEDMTTFMGRCMSSASVKESKPHRPTRAGFCYSEYQNRYLSTIAKKWS